MDEPGTDTHGFSPPAIYGDEGFQGLLAPPAPRERAVKLSYLLREGARRERACACYSAGFIPSVLQSRSWMT